MIGAHSLGFNSGTVGVALIGNYTRAAPPPAEQSALVGLLAWRLDVAHVDPLSQRRRHVGRQRASSSAGKVVTLRAISGHRDTGPTECPGNRAYALLPSLAKRVAQTGLPKLYSVAACGALGGPVRFQGAALVGAAVDGHGHRRRAGKVVAKGAGSSTLVDWTWSSARRRQGAVPLAHGRAGRRCFRRRGRSARALPRRAGAEADPATPATTPPPTPAPPPVPVAPAALVTGLTVDARDDHAGLRRNGRLAPPSTSRSRSRRR